MGLVKPGEGFRWIRLYGMPVDMGRNEMVRRFLEGEGERLLMVDSDMVFAAGSLERLASRDVDMVAGLCFTRYIPPLPTVFRDVTRVREDGREFLRIQCQETLGWLELHPEALQERACVLTPAPVDAMVRADATGGAFLLVHRRVFEGVEEPWFERDALKRGEDFNFFQKARRAGFELWVDRSVMVGHLWGEEMAIGAEDFVAYQAVYPVDRVVET